MSRHGRIIITNLYTGQSIIFADVQNAAEYLKLTRTQVYRLLERGNASKDGWVVDEVIDEQR